MPAYENSPFYAIAGREILYFFLICKWEDKICVKIRLVSELSMYLCFRGSSLKPREEV